MILLDRAVRKNETLNRLLRDLAPSSPCSNDHSSIEEEAVELALCDY